MGQVLIVGSQADDALARRLGREGHRVHRTADLRGALPSPPPDLVVVDGPEWLLECRRLRLDPATARTPVLVVSPGELPSELASVLRPDAGRHAPIPVARKDVLAWARRLLETPGAGEGRTLVGGLLIDRERHEVLVEGTPVRLTPSEFLLLDALASEPLRVFRRGELLERVAGPDAATTERAIDAHVRCLRRKLGGLRACIETVRGVGYCFQPPPPPDAHPDGDGEEQVGAQRSCLVGAALPAGVALLEPQEPCTIGRDPASAVVLAHDAVSRRHADIVWERGAFVLSDHSHNGTLVEGRRIAAPHRLSHGERVQVGPFSLTYLEFSDPAELEPVLARLVDTETRDWSAPPAPRAGTDADRAFAGEELVRACQLISIRGRDACIRVEGTTAAGELVFVAGILRSARCGDLTGEAAARRLLGETSGRYRVLEFDSEQGGDDASLGAADESPLHALQRTQRLLQSLVAR
ncbi:MAG: FHA domain-containing protein [Planctomycetota bacterium]|nr:MAG: FHA domain-containing protein [Planctomycetota bacterium]